MWFHCMCAAAHALQTSSAKSMLLMASAGVVARSSVICDVASSQDEAEEHWTPVSHQLSCELLQS